MSGATNTLGVVKRNIVRADKGAVEKLSRFGVATVHEAMGRVGLMNPYMRPIYADAHACGTAVTVLLPRTLLRDPGYRAAPSRREPDDARCPGAVAARLSGVPRLYRREHRW